MTDKDLQPIAWLDEYGNVFKFNPENVPYDKGVSYGWTPLYTLDQARIILDNEKKKSND